MSRITCTRCGQPIEHIHYIDMQPYGSTCYIIRLKELGIPFCRGIKEAAWEIENIDRAFEFAEKVEDRNAWKYLKKAIGNRAWEIIFQTYRGHALRIAEGTELQYYSLVHIHLREKFPHWSRFEK